MGVVITITSGKGGTGKTSITAGVAGCLAQQGHSVLCIDMDIGLRNLDISLGLNDRALMDFSDVALGYCELDRAAVVHPDLPGLSLLTAPMTLPAGLDETRIERLLSDAAGKFEYVLIDSPAGIGSGFRLAVCRADRALVAATNDTSSLRDAQRTVCELAHLSQVHLVMNRVQPKLLRKLATTIDDAMDTTGLPLLGVVPEDPRVILSANQGKPLALLEHRGAALACWNIALRLAGQQVPVMRIR